MFHVKDGWFFERLSDGSVHLFKKAADGYHNTAALVMDANTWASVISSMSIGGEANGGFYRALDFHTGSNHNADTGSEITKEEQLALNEVQNFADQLKDKPETFINSLPEGLLVRKDMWSMLDEIKAYTNQHPGEIRSADLPSHLMFGFIHDDGTYWGIRISDMKRSLGQSNPHPTLQYDRNEMIKRSIQTFDGKKSLCLALSNLKDK